MLNDARLLAKNKELMLEVDRLKIKLEETSIKLTDDIDYLQEKLAKAKKQSQIALKLNIADEVINLAEVFNTFLTKLDGFFDSEPEAIKSRNIYYRLTNQAHLIER